MRYTMKEAANRILERLPQALPAFVEGDEVQLGKDAPFEVVKRVVGFETRLQFSEKALKEVGVWVCYVGSKTAKRGRKVPFLVPVRPAISKEVP